MTHNRDDALLALISTRLRIGVTPHVAARSLVEALKSIIDRDSSPELWRCMAATEDSVIRRLTRKLKTGSFDENRQKKKSSLLEDHFFWVVIHLAAAYKRKSIKPATLTDINSSSI